MDLLQHLSGHCIDCIARADPTAHRMLRVLSKLHRTAIIRDIPYRSELVCFFKKCATFMLQDDAIWKLSVETQTHNFIHLQAVQAVQAGQAATAGDAAYFCTLLQALQARCHTSYQEVGEKNVFFFTYKNHDACYVLTSAFNSVTSQSSEMPSLQYQFTWPEAMDILTRALPSTVLFGKQYLIHMHYLYHPDYTHAYAPSPAKEDPCLEYALHRFFKTGLEEVFHVSIEQLTLCMPKIAIASRPSIPQDAKSTHEQPIVMIHRWACPFSFTFVVRIYDLSVLIWQVAPAPSSST